MSAPLRHQSASTDANSINGLMKVMRALESAVFPIDVDQMWNDCFPVLRQGYTKTGQDMMDLLAGLKSTLKELKHFLSSINCLAGSLEKTIPLVEANYRSMALSHGMNTAPVDVLDRIFAIACYEDIQMAFKLTLVNRQFRDIAVHNPRLWREIDNLNISRVSLGQLQVCLKRSKDVGLDVALYFYEDVIPEGVTTLGIAVPEASRWENVSYFIDSSHDWLDLFRDISRYSTGLNLPRLKSATLCYPRCDEDKPESIVDHSEPLMHFYTTWYLPSLTDLSVYNLFPRPFLHFSPPLTTLNVEVSEHENVNIMMERVYDMDLLLGLLRSSPLLKNFRLRLDGFTPSTKDNDHTLPETVLPNLQTFEFTALSLTAQSLLPFMKALRFPSLRNLHVCVDADMETIDFWGNVWLDCVLPHSYEQYMNIENFSYRTHTSKTIADLGYYPTHDVPFEKLHNLHSITLETPYLNPSVWRSYYDSGICMRLPNLKNIRFVQCNALSGGELRFFKDLLEEQDKWDTLKEIAFKGCKSLSEGTARSLFEGKDVTWEE